MVERVKIDSIAKYNLEKKIVKAHAPNIVSPNAKDLRKALEQRIEKEIPTKFLTAEKHKNGRLVRFMPTETQKRMVWQMAAMGASAQIIRLAILDPDTSEPITEPILFSNFSEIMKHAREQANFTVALKIYEIAIGNDAEYDNEGNLIKTSNPPNLEALRWWDRSRGEARRLFELRKANSEDEGTNVTLIIEAS